MLLECSKKIPQVRLLSLDDLCGASSDRIENERNEITKGMCLSIVICKFYFEDLELLLERFEGDLVEFVGIVR